MKIFIDKEINQYFGEDASKRLDVINDLKYYTDEGVLKVDRDRWLDAQYFENKIWKNNPSVDDRNFEHMLCFNNYHFLQNIQNVDIIELGCGPFTNLRLIIDKIKNINNIDLLDPLIMNYVENPNCSYKNGKIQNENVNLISSSIEDYNFNKKYDIVVMINVLEHCFDMNLIFKKIKSILKDDGLFIFSDTCIKNELIKDFGKSLYDSGHPLRVSESKLNEYLEDYDKIYYKEYYQRYNQPWRIDKYCALKLKK